MANLGTHEGSKSRLDLNQRPLGYECNHQRNLKTIHGAKSNALFLRRANWNRICPCVALVIRAKLGGYRFEQPAKSSSICALYLQNNFLPPVPPSVGAATIKVCTLTIQRASFCAGPARCSKNPRRV